MRPPDEASFSNFNDFANHRIDSIRMDASASPVWQRIEAFVFDLPKASLPFTSRLAREQGWTHARAPDRTRWVGRDFCGCPDHSLVRKFGDSRNFPPRA